MGALALLCFAVLVFSYLLTLTIALVCLALPVVLFTRTALSLGGFVLGGMGLIIGGTILWALFPRRAEFKLAGVEIDLSSQPRLKQLIEEIAARIDRRMPESVYLIPEANAFVLERDRRRIMGLGLPLIANMSTAAFSGVLTHEFAHYYSGDTRLGPRVYQTRTAMARTIQNLGSRVVRPMPTTAKSTRLYLTPGPGSFWDSPPLARSQAITCSCSWRMAASNGVSWPCPTQFRSAPCARR